MSDKIEPRIVALAGMIIGSTGHFLLVMVNSQTSVATLVLYFMLLGIGFALFSSPNTNAAMNAVEKNHMASHLLFLEQ